MKPKEVELAALGYPNLDTLALHLKGGRIHDVEALAAWPSLRRLLVIECYEMSPDRFPRPTDMPELQFVEFHSLRKTDAAVLRKRLKGLRGLKLSGSKSNAWLAANADNPFNNWVDESARLGKAACKIYKRSHGRVTKLGAEDFDAYHEEMVGFVRAFNHLDSKHGLDTVHREHIYDAFHELAEASPVVATPAVLAQWFDEDREF
ncbi:MAG: hypothetical protein JRH11_21680 [Deltaproteobacteria bacterium]|nr:hypothetical protein [Deltaproteobacteria bacterium]